MNNTVVRHRLTPAHVTPVTTLRRAEHAGEITVGAGRPTRSGERWTGIGIGPGHAAVGRAIELVNAVGQPAALFVHAGEENRSGRPVNRQLYVADEGVGNLFLGPGCSIIGEADEDALAATEVIPRDIQTTVVWAARVVIDGTRLAVVERASVNAEVGPAIWIRRSGRLITAHALSATANINPHRKPRASGALIENHRIAERIRKWA